MKDLISRQAAIDAIDRYYKDKRYITRSRTILSAICRDMKSTMDSLPSAQPQCTELTPEEAASEIASGSIMSASYWLDVMIRLKQMGYAICRKR